MESAWVLRLKDEFKEEYMDNENYYLNDSEDDEFITVDLQEATIIKDKQAQIDYMTNYEKKMKELYGDDCICNFGITHITKHFEFVEVELRDADVNYCVACDAEIDAEKEKTFNDAEGGLWCQACGKLELNKNQVI
ncbi:hypothetical protein ACF3OH_12030 [Chryseomicrobium aureum]|uniref:hypothetical protein n=1 Tax=Chryseomicrobium aureum TaxID=1441723 RepID=UPI00370D3A83